MRDRTSLKILIFFDEPGWAWWHRAHNIKRHASSNLSIDILKISEPFDCEKYDFILLFESYLYQQISHVPQHKVILGSSTLKSLPGAVEIYKSGYFAGFVVNNLEAFRLVGHLPNVFCCENGVDEELFCFKYPRSNELTACWVGSNRSMNNKGIDLIKDACDCAGVKLLLVEQSENIYKGKLLTQEQVRDDVYHKASFYICASEMEGTPNPALESLACGLPVISTRVGNMPEVIVDGYNGYLVERNVNAIVEAIGKLKRTDLVKMSLNARQSILNGWTWKQQIKKYEQLFSGISKNIKITPHNRHNHSISLHTKMDDMSSHSYHAPKYLEPLISVILPTYNRPEILRQCLEGFVQQTIAQNTFEVVVVDDGSSPPVKPVVDCFSDKFKITYYYQENGGLANARNECIKRALTPLLALHDDDDVPEPDYLERCLDFHKRYPHEADILLAKVIPGPKLKRTPLLDWVFDGVNGIIGFPDPLIIHGYLRFYGGTSSCKKSLFRHGLYDPAYRFGFEDMELALRINKTISLRVHYDPNVFSKMIRPVDFYGLFLRSYKEGRSHNRFFKRYGSEALQGVGEYVHNLGAIVSVDGVKQVSIAINFLANWEEYGYEINEECSIKVGNNSYKGVSALNACYTVCVSYARAKGWVDHDMGIAEDVGLDELRILLHKNSKELKSHSDNVQNEKRLDAVYDEEPTRDDTAVRGSRVIVYFAQNPYPGKTGTHKRCLNVIDAFLQLGYEVTFFSHAHNNPYCWDEPSVCHFIGKGVNVELYVPSQNDEDFVSHAWQQNPNILNIDYHCPPGIVYQFKTLFNKLQPDIVFVIYVYSFGLISGLDLSRCLTIVDSNDLVSLSGQLFNTLYAYLGTPPYDPATVFPALLCEDFFDKFHFTASSEEFCLYDKYDCTLAISQGEAKQMRQATTKTDVLYLPITFSPTEIDNSYASNPVLIAADNPFNIQAYLYFARRVLPTIIDHEPNFKLEVIGGVTSKLVSIPGVQLTNFVENLGSVYADACFAVCPIIGGTGMSVKVVEAMAHGLPVVVLHSSTQETIITHGIDGFVANNALEFAHYTLLLYKNRDLCAKMGQAARTTVKEEFSTDLFIEKLASLLTRHSYKNEVGYSDSRKKEICLSNTLIKKEFIQSSEPNIVIDGVIFQLQYGRPFGISRMWWSLLTELAATPLAGRIVLLDREGTAPEIPGIRRRMISAFQLGAAREESAELDRICCEENAALFISTYYTYTTLTPSLLMLYDMIPERFDTVGPDAPNPEWRDKYHAIVNSTSFAAISHSTARDLATCYPQAAQRPLTVIPCAVSAYFRVHSAEEIAAFKAANGIDRPYYLLVGRRDPHKNAALFFQAFAQLPDRERYAIVMAGGGNTLEPELRELVGPAAGYAGFFSDQDLSLAYSGAIALIYPSLYEGFGLPILEAMQSGCPVITCQNSSLSEVAGSAALYVGEYDREDMTKALLSVQQPDIRSYLIKRGLERARLFSWQKSAELLTDVIIKSVANRATLPTPGGN